MNKVKDSNQNIAKAVLKIRQDNKLSQEQFAEMVGVTSLEPSAGICSSSVEVSPD